MKHICILYHFPCPDGAFGAFAAYLYFKQLKSIDIDFKFSFLPQRVEIAPIAVDSTVTDVICIDWTGSLGFILNLSEYCDSIVLLDHHKTAIDALAELGDTLPSNVENRCSVEHSGAMLAWNYFSNLIEDEELRERVFTPELRRLFEYVEDRDLWLNALPDSKAVSTAIANAQYNFDIIANPRLWDELGSIGFESMRLAGLQQVAATEAAVNAELRNLQRIIIDRGEVGFAVECLVVLTERKSLRSEIGNALAARSAELGLAPIGVVAYVESSLNNDDMLKVSLRSIGDTDTSAIAKRHGGGGHANASSFNLQKKKFNRWLL